MMATKKLTIFIAAGMLSTLTFVILCFFVRDLFILLPAYLLFLLIISANFFIKGNDLLSPLTWFSITYFGYVIGGVYYSFGPDNYGKFIRLVDIPFESVPEYMGLSLFWAIICYLFFAIGYSTFSKGFNSTGRIMLRSNNFLNYKVSVSVAGIFIIIGLIYWIYIAYSVTDGIVDLLIKFQAFRHLIADSNLSTLPYHFYYAGIFLWLAAIVGNGKKIGPLFVFLSAIGMIINMSQGRIMLSITFVLAQIFFIALCNRHDSNKSRFVFKVFLLGALAVAVYFLRILSNYYFIDFQGVGISDNTPFYREFFERIIGSGNIADLQQLVIIFYTWSWFDSMWGITYLDWLRNSIGEYFGFSPSSVGLMIRDIYFQGESGPPTPGAIGEAFVNFGVLAPFFMLSVGGFFAIIYESVKRSRSYLAVMLYAIFLARFILLYPKVDSTMLLNFIWGAFPFLFSVLIVNILVGSMTRVPRNNNHDMIVR